MGPRSWHWGVRRARERSPKTVVTMRPMAEPLAPHSDQSQDCWAWEGGALPSASGPGSGLRCDTDVGRGALKNKCVWTVHLDLPPSFPDWKYLTNYADVPNKQWFTACPFMLSTRFLGLKSIIILNLWEQKSYRAGYCQPNQETLIRDSGWEHSSALLVMKTGIKICRSRSCLSGAQPANTVTQPCKQFRYEM